MSRFDWIKARRTYGLAAKIGSNGRGDEVQHIARVAVDGRAHAPPGQASLRPGFMTALRHGQRA